MSLGTIEMFSADFRVSLTTREIESKNVPVFWRASPILAQQLFTSDKRQSKPEQPTPPRCLHFPPPTEQIEKSSFPAELSQSLANCDFSLCAAAKVMLFSLLSRLVYSVTALDWHLLSRVYVEHSQSLSICQK